MTNTILIAMLTWLTVFFHIYSHCTIFFFEILFQFNNYDMQFVNIIKYIFKTISILGEQKMNNLVLSDINKPENTSRWIKPVCCWHFKVQYWCICFHQIHGARFLYGSMSLKCRWRICSYKLGHLFKLELFLVSKLKQHRYWQLLIGLLIRGFKM